MLPLPAFPNVPDLPGVPPVARVVGTNLLAAGVLLGADMFSTPAPEQWGIVDAHLKFQVVADSFVSMEYDRGTEVADYPIEKGQFASYNKVHRPFRGTVTLARGGSEEARMTFLEALNALIPSVTPYYIIVPEGSIGPLTIESVQYGRHASQGRSLIKAVIRFCQIRVVPPRGYNAPPSQVPASSQTSLLTSTGTPDPTAVQNPSAAAMTPLGQVQPGVANPALLSAFNAQAPV